MNNIHILNPVAGQGAALKYKSNDYNEVVHITSGIGDAEKFVYDTCLENPDTRFIVYGGDGTLNEVINGIMKSGANNYARISIVPVGTGNDFRRNFPDSGEYTVDVIKYNGRYSVNIINMGFDCNAVEEMNKWKKVPLISGSPAYVLGVLTTLCKPMGKKLSVEFTDINNNELCYDGEFLLAAIANGAYYGGGFHAAPLSSLTDGLLDVMIVNKIPRLKFFSLVGDYKNGTHMDKNTLKPIKKFEEIINFYKCKSLKINNIDKICVDGEILYESSLEIEVIRQAITFVIE
jgi:Sphingosine kinase and enzymes related to eukaryotic diacylglycerol kinase